MKNIIGLVLYIGLVLFLGLALPSFAGTLYSEDFSGAAGPVSGWSIVTGSGTAQLSKDGSGGGEITKSGYPGILAYTAQTWGDMTWYFDVGNIGAGRIDWMVRTNVINTSDIRYIYVYGYASGNWYLVYDNGPSWVYVGASALGTTFGAWDTVGIRVTGAYPSITVTILKNGTPTTATWTFNPGNSNLDTGTIGILPEWNGPEYVDNFLVMDYPEGTPTFTPTATPTITMTASPTFTITPTSTITPEVNQLTFFDHFYANGVLDGRSPDVSFSGGTWSDPGGNWKVSTTGVEWGYLTGVTTLAPKGDTRAQYDMNVLQYPVLYNLSFRPLNLFESGDIHKGWIIRKGTDGALAIIADTTSALGTTITVKSWDAAGNTTTIASAPAPGVLPRPGYNQSSLAVVDTGDTLTVYWDYTNVLPDAVARTATALVLVTNTTLWNVNDMFGPWFEAGSGAYVSNFAAVVERYATMTSTATPTPSCTVTPTLTATPTTNITPETGTGRRVFRYDNKERKLHIDNKDRKFMYDNRRRRVYESH